MTHAYVFPGQGAQTVGMGKDLAQAFPEARFVFQEVDDALDEKLSSIIWEGPSETLTLTENAQPALMATSIAYLRVLEKELGVQVIKTASYVAGHSLGEYTALCAAGALPIAQTARLLRVRGKAMQQAVLPGAGAMAALLGADFAQAEAIAAEAQQGEVCAVANDNAPGQAVISGGKAAVERAVEIAKAKGVKRAIMLQVSAPFHCSLMAPAAGVMAEALGAADLRMPCVPLIANVNARPVSEPDDIRRLLVDQVTGMVRWRESVEQMKERGITQITELGAGKVLTGLIKRIAPEIETLNVGTLAEIEQFAKVV